MTNSQGTSSIKESDIRPSELFQKFLDLSSADAKTYFNQERRMSVPCPACGSSQFQEAFNKWSFDYVVCDNCTTLYQSPRPSNESFSRFYKESPSVRFWAKEFFPTVAEERRIKLFRPKVKEIAKLCIEDKFNPHLVADVGAGYGLFLEEWGKIFPTCKLTAIEPNPGLADICRSKKFEVVECFAEQAKNIHNQFDLAVSLEVIEHVYDPLSFCKSLQLLLKKEGRALITGLTVDGFDIQVLWKHSKSVSPPHHINFISVKGFEILLKRAGFSNVRVFTPGRLDVDIVRNSFENLPMIFSECRFVNTILKKNEKTQNAFQQFLSKHQLSSHCWVWAKK